MSNYTRKIFSFECDIYGHLNNAAYLKIYEEARAVLLDELGYSLEDLLHSGISLYLTEIHLQFIKEIKSGTIIKVTTSSGETTRVRFNWNQEMVNESGEICSTAEVSGVFIRNGKPTRVSPEILSALKDFRV